MFHTEKAKTLSMLVGRLTRQPLFVFLLILLPTSLLTLEARQQSQSQPQQPQSQQADRKLPVQANLVNVLATVRDKHGQIVSNLNKEDFVLQEDDHPQTITYFARETDLPLTLGLLVDTSRSQTRISAGAQRKLQLSRSDAARQRQGVRDSFRP